MYFQHGGRPFITSPIFESFWTPPPRHQASPDLGPPPGDVTGRAGQKPQTRNTENTAGRGVGSSDVFPLRRVKLFLIVS